MIWMFLDQNPFDEEDAWKNWRVSLLMLLPMCASHALLMQVVYLRLMRFSCK